MQYLFKIQFFFQSPPKPTRMKEPPSVQPPSARPENRTFKKCLANVDNWRMALVGHRELTGQEADPDLMAGFI